MAKITGLGGFFFKTDGAATGAWFKEKLGVPMEAWGQMFPWLDRDGKTKGYTVLGLHKRDSDYFTGSSREFMLNLRVDDLDGVLADLAKQGIPPVRTCPPEPTGKFAHIPGPDGMTIELWEPAAEDPYDPGP